MLLILACSNDSQSQAKWLMKNELVKESLGRLHAQVMWSCVSSFLSTLLEDIAGNSGSMSRSICLHIGEPKISKKPFARPIFPSKKKKQAERSKKRQRTHTRASSQTAPCLPFQDGPSRRIA